MSEYPRPPLQAPKPFRPDHYVGWVGFFATAGNLVYWLYVVQTQSSLATVFLDQPAMGFTMVAFTALILWLFTLLARSRRVAFLAFFWIFGFLLLGIMASVLFLRISVPTGFVPESMLWAYCVVRLFGLWGPRPGSIREASL